MGMRRFYSVEKVLLKIDTGGVSESSIREETRNSFLWGINVSCVCVSGQVSHGVVTQAEPAR